MSKKVEFAVAPRRNYYDGQYWPEWRINRVERLSGGLVARRPVAEVLGSRRHAQWVAEAMNLHTRRKSKFALIKKAGGSK